MEHTGVKFMEQISYIKYLSKKYETLHLEYDNKNEIKQAFRYTINLNMP